MKGLVLEGGAVRGAYQVGAYYAFRDCHVKFNGIVGASSGSFNAAMLASNQIDELLEFWTELDPAALMKFDARFVDSLNKGKIDKNLFLGAFTTFKDVIKNTGFDYSGILELAESKINYDKLIKSSIDYGLVTVKISKKHGIKPLYITKDDICSKQELIEYILASCYFPIFRYDRIIDNHYYLDGGFYDNAPFKLLVDKGYKDIYIVNVRGVGINKEFPVGVNLTYITPSRDNGKLFELNKDVIKDNTKMGYYDTLRVLKRLDGYKYCFKVRSESYYKFLCRKVDRRLFKRVMNFFAVDTYKEVVLKAMEYVLEKDSIDYYDIYNISKFIKKYRKNSNRKFIFRFIRELKFFW